MEQNADLFVVECMGTDREKHVLAYGMINLRWNQA